MVLDRRSSETSLCGRGALKLHEKHDSSSHGLPATRRKAWLLTHRWSAGFLLRPVKLRGAACRLAAAAGGECLYSRAAYAPVNAARASGGQWWGMTPLTVIDHLCAQRTPMVLWVQLTR